MKLKTKFTLIVSILIAIFSLIALFAFSHYMNSIKETIAQQQFLMVSTLADELDSKLLTAQQDLIAFAKVVPPDIMQNQEKAQLFLDNKPILQRTFDNHIFLLTPSGKLFIESPYMPGRRGLDFSFREFVSKTLKTEKPYISDPYVTTQSHKPTVITFTVPLFGDNGKITGILGAGIDLKKENFLGKLSTIKIGETGYLVLSAADRTLIMHPDKQRILTKQAPGLNVLHDKAIAGFEGTGETITSYGTKMLSSYKRLKAKNWILIADYPQAEAYRPIQAAERYFIITTVTGIMAVFFIISFTIKCFIKPLELLTQHVKDIPQKTGDDRFLDIKTNDEIGTLSLAFNKMVTEIDKRPALEQSEERFQLAMEATRDGLWDWNVKTNEVYYSPGYAAMLGYTSCEVPGQVNSWMDLLHPEDKGTALERNMDCIENRCDVFDVEFRMQARNGEWRWILGRGKAVSRDISGRAIRMIGTHTDITERKRVEEKLRASEGSLRESQNIAGLGSYILDVPAGLWTSSDVLDKLFGIDEAYERSLKAWEALVHPDDRTMLVEHLEKEVIGQGMIFDREYRIIRHNDKVERWVYGTGKLELDVNGRPLKMHGTIQDITQRKTLDEHIQQSQKLEAIGTLAGGIAHDFNNLLQGVFGYISMAKMTLERREKSLVMLEQAEKALHMTVNLTTQLLTFSKGGKPVRKKMPLQPVIENSVRFALSGSSADYQIKLDADLWHVEADEGQIGQVIQNIVLNADQSMPMAGTIVITAMNVRAPKNGIPQLQEEGKYVEISVQDNGIGISKEYLSKIFDPYFTTKTKGSGLGLATCYSIIKNHGGVIHVSSKVGKGTTIYVYLPAIEAEKESTRISELSPFIRKVRILLMDDEEIIRDIAGKMIGVFGHEVELAEHGEAAIEKYRAAMESGNTFDIVILDLTIRGGMGGERLLSGLLQSILRLELLYRAVTRMMLLCLIIINMALVLA